MALQKESRISCFPGNFPKQFATATIIIINIINHFFWHFNLDTRSLLNPQSGYMKIDAYLLIVCNVISDVKLSHFFFFQKLSACSRSSQYLNIGKLLHLNTNHFKPSLFLVFLCVFISLNCNMNRLRLKYFSVDVMF